MHPEIARAWSVLLIRGICNVLFALFAFIQPGLTLVTLVLLWGVYAVVDGAMSLTTGIAARRGGGHSWSLVASGACGLVAGVLACIWPGVTLFVLLAIMALWAIVRGALEIAAAIKLRHILPRAWLLAVSGAASVLFGVLLLVRPAAGSSRSSTWSAPPRSSSGSWQSRWPCTSGALPPESTANDASRLMA